MKNTRVRIFNESGVTMRQFTRGLFFLMSVVLFSCTRMSELHVGTMTCNNSLQPLGVESPQPFFSWEITSSASGGSQTAYRILVAEHPDKLLSGSEAVWDSKKIESDQSVNVVYAGKPLESGKYYYWKVKVWDQKGHESEWSETGKWQMGLLSAADWNGAKWISLEPQDSSKRLVPGTHELGNTMTEKSKRPVIPMFRKAFRIEKELASATLYISGMGHYEAYLNGVKTGDSFIAPGWTDYDKTVYYNAYDVAPLLKTGDNALGAIVGTGFYNIHRERYRKLIILYGNPEMICQLKLNYTDGTSETIVSDESWKTVPSPITYTSIYSGEDYDANLEQPGWDKDGFDDSGWSAVSVNKGPSGKLTSEQGYPVKEMEVLSNAKIYRLKDGSYLYDFGQNASGIIELSVKGEKGQQVKLWPSELINRDSTCNQQASGSPYYFAYTLKGGGAETWKPKFTYYGFRYVQVFGATPSGFESKTGAPVIEKLNFIHTRNSAPSNGTFSCSNERLNRIHKLIDWAIRSNFQSVLTDCPHREKLGWIEQTFLMGAGIHFSYENYHLYRKLVYDMMDAQTAEGLVPDIAPEYVRFSGGFLDSPEWGSAGVIIPYLLYKWYGDKQIVDDAWPMMMKYVSYLKGKSQGHILDFGLGDWFDLGPKAPGVAQLTPVSLTATAIYYYDVKLLAEMASVGNREEKDLLSRWAEEIRAAFNAKFYKPETKIYSTGSQTAMSMPLCFGMMDKKDEKAVIENLFNTINAGNKALTAGDVGFHYLVEALTRSGASQLLFEMINRDDVPGYGFQLRKGATALTESWQALEVVSNNHLMLGHVMEWFYTGLAGIGQAENSVAFKEIVINPQLVNELSFVKANFQSPYGLIRSEWKKTDNQFEIEVEIPVNTTAKIILPSNIISPVRVNGEKPGPEISLHQENGHVILQVPSGVYCISVDL